MEQVHVSKYETPELEQGKKVVMLAKTDIMNFGIQLVKEGGETNLHSHPGSDAYWFVLSGRARFYGEGDEVVADITKNEGVTIPRGFKYWFESVGKEALEIIRAGGNMPSVKEQRVDFAPMTEATKAAYAGVDDRA